MTGSYVRTVLRETKTAKYFKEEDDDEEKPTSQLAVERFPGTQNRPFLSLSGPLSSHIRNAFRSHACPKM
ncbi:hypothetical protein C0Q70_03049 [Pomacea canaliculata]|uniref:Uncharacterized protein n=1 Tax=Pomacea canaliculata TaxID=400727 RepID=A0A2T7PRM7_POMCA|nr:hypothetical protein C0Q70_03049 [Pomacea canaliculata]